MTEPERLFHGSESELTRTMLGAAREEMPDERLLQRTLLAVGTGAAVLGAAGAAGGMGAGTSSLSALAAKWFGIGAIGGIVTMGAAVGVEHALEPKVEVAEKSVTAAAPTQVQIVQKSSPVQGKPESAPEPTPTAKLAVVPPPSAPRSQATTGEPSIGAELSAIDDARAALASGDSARALSLVAAYERQPGPKRMSQEALAIRMEAQSRSGDVAGARASAERLLTLGPNGPQAARARQILGR